MDYTKALVITQIGRQEEDKFKIEFFSKCSDQARTEIKKVLKKLPFITFVSNNSFIMQQMHMENVKDCLRNNDFCYIITDQTEEAKIKMEAGESEEVEESDTDDDSDSTPSLVSDDSLTVKISKDGVVSLSKFDANVVKVLKALNKDHRKFDREKMTWTINNAKTRKEFIDQLRKMFLNVEVYEDQNSPTSQLATKTGDVIIKISKSGVVSTSKYDAKVVEMLKEINKEYRQYDKEKFTWKISDAKALQTLKENFKAMNFTVVEEA